jgi:hypothetical protein
MQSTLTDVREQLKLSPLDWAWRWLANTLLIALGCLSAGLISITITGDRGESDAVVSTWLVLTVVLAGVIISAGQYCFFRRAIQDGSVWFGSSLMAVSALLGLAIHSNTISPVSGLLIGLFSSLVQWFQLKASVRDAHWWIIINVLNWTLVFWYASQFAP